MAEQTVIGKIGITPKGEYNPETVYDILDAVSNNGNSYVSRQANNTEPLTDSEAWMLMAEKSQLFTDMNLFNSVKGSLSDPSFTFPLGDWNSTLREIGNVFKEKNGDLIWTYSAYVLPYNQNLPIIGALKSIDNGQTWEDMGQLTEPGFEDPYLVYFKGQYYLFTEKKQLVDIHLGINVHIGNSLDSLEDMGVVIGKSDDIAHWCYTDRSSPTVLVDGNKLVMFWEGRNIPIAYRNQGAIGVSTSDDGINWDTSDSPIIVGYEYNNENILPNTTRVKWASHLVPDDIVKMGDEWVMTSHAYNGRTFALACFYSKDLITWRDKLNTWMTLGDTNNENAGNGVSLYKDQKNDKLYAYYIWTNNGQYHLYIGEFYNKIGNLGSYGVGNTGYRLVPAQRNEKINFSTVNSNRTMILAADINSGAGITKQLRNPTSFTITLNADEGVLIDGAASLVINPYTIVDIVLSAPNTWVVWSVVPTPNKP